MVYQIHNKNIENQPESFYITFDDKEGDVIYLNKDFYKVIVNFVRIEMTCLKCRSFFLSKSKLYRHVKADCMEKALLLSFAQPFLFIPIVMLKTIY